MAACGGLCFDEGAESFHTYEQRFTRFVDACEIPQGKHGAALLAVVGARTAALLADLLAPRTPSECSLDDILNALRDFHVRKKNVLRDRYKFRARTQQHGESLSEYVDALEALAAPACEFSEQVEEQLRDQLVYGIRSEELRTKLFVAACGGEHLTWDKVVDIANNYEATTRSLIMASGSESISIDWKPDRKRCRTEGHPSAGEHDESRCHKKQQVERTCGDTSAEEAVNRGGGASGQHTAEKVPANPGSAVLLSGPRFRRIHVVIPRSTALQLSRDQKMTSEDGSNVHTSIFRTSSPPQVTRCTVCCSHFHCPLCPSDLYKPRCKAKVLLHLESHIKHALHYKDFCMTKCHQACRSNNSSGHFHCPVCPKTVVRRRDAMRHVEICLQDGDQLPVLSSDVAGEVQGQPTETAQEDVPASDRSKPESSMVSNRPCRVHVTIQRGKSLPTLKRCTRCCDLYHCPFCLPTCFQPAQLNKVRLHLDNHFTRAIVHEGYNIHRCGLGCRPQLHYHCLYCGLMPFRKVDFVKHLSVCKKKRSAVTPAASASTTAASSPAPATPGGLPRDPEGAPAPAPQLKKPVQHKHCPVCELLVNKKNLKKHIERRHASKHEDTAAAAFHLQSECVDPEIYTVDKSFFGH